MIWTAFDIVTLGAFEKTPKKKKADNSTANAN